MWLMKETKMKLIMTKGLPASGKTTWAKQQNAFRINKDDLRSMMNNGIWSKTNEKYVLRVRDSIIEMHLADKNDVIVDDTNLAPKHETRLRELAVKYGADFEIKDFTDVSLEECIKRDQKRVNYVGEKVIKDMYKKFVAPRQARGTALNPFIQKADLPYGVIFDLDGTLACIGDRSPYDGKACAVDKVNMSVKKLLDSCKASGYEIIIFSGRNGDSMKETEQWLKDNDIHYDLISMRAAGDFRKDDVVKHEMFNRYIKDQYNILFVIDDRDQVVNLWRSLGLTCLQVAPGDF